MADWTCHLPPSSPNALGAVVLDEQFRIRAVSPSVLDIAGYTHEEMLARTALDVVHPDDLARAADVMAEVRSIPGRRAEGLYRLIFADGSAHQFCLHATNLGPDNENAIIYEFEPPTDRLRIEAFSEDVVDVMQSLAEHRPLDQCIEEVLRLSERHILGARPVVTVFDLTAPNSVTARHSIDDAWRATNKSATPHNLPAHVQAALDAHRAGPWRASNRAGCVDELMPGRVTSVLTDGDQIIGFVESIQSSPESPEHAEWLVHALVRRVLTTVILRNRLDAQLRQAADHDPLTGLVNRRFLLDSMEADANPIGSIVLMVDLDQFSWINNTLGHLVGDAALVSTAHSLRAACPTHATVARIGGDEFLVWIPAAPDTHDRPPVDDVAQTIRRGLTTPVELPHDQPRDRRAFVRASIGAVVMAAGESPGEAISRADDAMYRAKRAGGDRVEHDITEQDTTEHDIT